MNAGEVSSDLTHLCLDADHKIVAQIPESEARKILRLVHLLIGTIDYVPLTSPAMDDRVRSRYPKEIAELVDLGFEYLCSEGQGFPLSRFFRVVPALMSLGLLFQRTPMWIQHGCIVIGYPILRWRRKPAFVELDGSHAKFISAFEDGTLLVSGNYDDPIARGPGIIRQFKAAPMAETWNNHRTRIDALEAIGKQIDPRSDYGTYAQAAARDRAAW